VDHAVSEPGRHRSTRTVGAIVVVVAVVAAVVAVGGRWDDARDRLGELTPGVLVLAGVAGLASLLASMLAWRAALAGLGAPLPLPVAGRVYFLGQLAKYVPGSVWSILGQSELARVHGVPRDRTATAGLVAMLISVAMALAVGVLALPGLAGGDRLGYAWVLVLLVPLAVALRPSVLARLTGLALRVLRRPPLPVALDGGDVAAVAGLSVVNHVATGTLVWLLAEDVGAGGGALLAAAIGGHALASACGLLAIPVPAGAGVREAVLVAVLTPSIGVAAAAVVAVVARLVLTVADLAAAGLAVVAARARPATVPPTATPRS